MEDWEDAGVLKDASPRREASRGETGVTGRAQWLGQGRTCSLSSAWRSFYTTEALLSSRPRHGALQRRLLGGTPDRCWESSGPGPTSVVWRSGLLHRGLSFSTPVPCLCSGDGDSTALGESVVRVTRHGPDCSRGAGASKTQTAWHHLRKRRAGSGTRAFGFLKARGSNEALGLGFAFPLRGSLQQLAVVLPSALDTVWCWPLAALRMVVFPSSPWSLYLWKHWRPKVSLKSGDGFYFF